MALFRWRAVPRASTDSNPPEAVRACAAQQAADCAEGPAAACARALLGFGFVVYGATLLASAIGLAPLASAWAARSLLALGALAAFDLVRRSLPPTRQLASRESNDQRAHAARALRWLGTGAGVLGLGAAVFVAALALALPIGAYDALGYRLPAIAQWLDAGAVVWVQGDDPLRNGYPLGLEVIAAVFFRATGSAAPVDAVSMLFVVAGAAALAGYARALAVPTWAARLAAGLFMLVPIHLLNAPSGYVDAALAGTLVALFVAVARWASATRPSRAWLDVGLSAALVTALKPHGFAFAAVALVGGIGWRARALGGRRAVQGFGRIAALASPGLFFAGRNAVITGNPLYPLELRVGGRVLLHGESSLDGILTPAFNVPRELDALPSLVRPLWVWLQPHGPARSFDDRMAGLGYAFVAVGVPALAWAVWRSSASGEARGLTLVLGLTFVCWLVQPLSFWPRFTSWLWGAAALAIAMWASELARAGRVGGALALVSSVLLLAAPEAVYAVAHVKGFDRLGLSVLRDDSVTALSRVAGVDLGFVRRALLGKRDVCRTPWLLGTDDANLDGVVAQLSPRPRMHVVDVEALGSEREPAVQALGSERERADARWRALADAVRAHGCDQLIAIGDSPLVHDVPSSWAARVEPAFAFGPCHLISLPPAEVTP